MNQLRTWQAEFLEHYQTKLNEGEKSFLLEATPGAGKTTAALTLAQTQLTAGAKRVVVVVPTRELRRQWARAAHHKGIELDPHYETGKPLSRDFQGVVVTYQQVANRPAAFQRLAAQGLVILDEVHHAGDGRAWGMGLREAFSGASFILCLSGTAFRSDQELIPFIRYMDNESDPDYVYSYRRAIQDQVCRPVAFTLYGGEVGYCFLPAEDLPEPLPVELAEEEKPEPTSKFRPLESSADVAMVVAGGQVAPAGVAQLGLFGNHQVIPQARAISLEAAAHEVLQRPQVVETRQKSVSMSERKQELGRMIKGLAGRYCSMTGQEFQQVYGKLNKMQGVYSQSNCTLDQLEQRLATLKNWLN